MRRLYQIITRILIKCKATDFSGFKCFKTAFLQTIKKYKKLRLTKRPVVTIMITTGVTNKVTRRKLK